MLSHLVVISAADVPSRASLYSANHNDLAVPQTRFVFLRCAFSVADPAAWNRLPADQKSTLSSDTFKCKFTTFLLINACDC